MTGNTRSIHGVSHTPPLAKMFCISMHRCAASRMPSMDGLSHCWKANPASKNWFQRRLKAALALILGAHSAADEWQLCRNYPDRPLLAARLSLQPSALWSNPMLKPLAVASVLVFVFSVEANARPQHRHHGHRAHGWCG